MYNHHISHELPFIGTFCRTTNVTTRARRWYELCFDFGIQTPQILYTRRTHTFTFITYIRDPCTHNSVVTNRAVRTKPLTRVELSAKWTRTSFAPWRFPHRVVNRLTRVRAPEMKKKKMMMKKGKTEEQEKMKKKKKQQ